MEEQLRRVLDAHRLPCGAVIVAPGEVVARVGDFDKFGSSGLVSALLGPYGSPAATFGCVQGDERLLPRMWAQGDDFAFIDRPAGGLVVVVFGRKRGDVLAQYRLSQLVGQSIRREFGSDPV